MKRTHTQFPAFLSQKELDWIDSLIGQETMSKGYKSVVHDYNIQDSYNVIIDVMTE